MNRLLRPYHCTAPCLVLVAGTIFVSAVPASAAIQAQQFTPMFADASTQAANVSQGYLGIDIADVDSDKAQTLHLKDAHGAVITLIDHDAPAGQGGLKVNDVILQLNGQPVDGADQFRHMLKDAPPGRKVTLEISREGNQQSFSLELVDRKLMEKDVWSKLGSSNNVPQMGILSGNTMPSGFHLPSFGSTLKVGAMVEPLTSQMAAYLGVDSGLMVKQVERKSEAETAGLHAFDVIIKVGTDAIATSADWERSLLANQGKPVQVTILRDKKQQTVTLQVDSKHHQGKVEQLPLSPEQKQELANLDQNLARLAEQIAAQADAQAAQAESEAQALRDRMKGMHLLTPETAEQLRLQTDKLRSSILAFQIDPQRMEELKKQIEQFRYEMEQWSAHSTGRFV